MRSRSGIFIILIIFEITACSIRPGQSTIENGGSDVVQPLWTEQSNIGLPIDTARCATVVALLIGIGQYNPANGWEILNARNDVNLLMATLRKRGVWPTHIHTLIDRQATKTGIERALQSLADTLPSGSQVIIHYAGHARQLPDETSDETDGYDEAIVPYDAPPANQNQPDGYLRDDELNRYLTQIRTTIGTTGSLWLLFDSCHSQTLHRGQSSPNQIGQRTRGGIAPMGRPAKAYPQRAGTESLKQRSDWYEMRPTAVQLAPYVLFSATIDSGPNFETTDASGQSFGPLTRAIGEVWSNEIFGETYRSLFERVAVVMARYAPYQQPGLEGDADIPTPGCGKISLASPIGYCTRGERLRVAWLHKDNILTKTLTNLPFVQRAATHPDLRIERRNRGYQLWATANNQLLSVGNLSVADCAERIQQYFARNMLLQFQQTSPDFRVRATMKRVSVQIEQGRTIVTDTLPPLTTAGLPTFRTSPQERIILTIKNIGLKPTYITVVDLQSDGSLHILLPAASQSAATCHLRPGQSLSQRIRITEPVGAEVYKILLTPEPIDLRAVLQTRGSSPVSHPYEILFQRTYTTRGAPAITPLSLSDKTGATADVAFWVQN